jgi:hypothetical protein
VDFFLRFNKVTEVVVSLALVQFAEAQELDLAVVTRSHQEFLVSEDHFDGLFVDGFVWP